MADTNDGRLRNMNDRWSIISKRFNPFRSRQFIATAKGDGDGEGEESKAPCEGGAPSGLLGLHERELEDKTFEHMHKNRPNQETSTISPWVEAALGLIHRWGKFFTSGAQIAIIAYLAHAIWSAAVSSIDLV